jgi:hypothetical protein
MSGLVLADNRHRLQQIHSELVPDDGSLAEAQATERRTRSRQAEARAIVGIVAR